MFKDVEEIGGAAQEARRVLVEALIGEEENLRSNLAMVSGPDPARDQRTMRS